MTSLDWPLLASLGPSDLQARLIAESDAVMGGHDAEEEDRLLAMLPQPLRAMWLVNWMDFEIAQGSMLAYFYNSHGRHARLAADVFHRIGAITMAAILSSSTQERNPASVEPGAMHRRSSHRTRPLATASMPTSSAAGPLGLSLVRSCHPDADDADQGVAGQGVRGRGHHPDGHVPPARRGGDHVHEHAGASRRSVQQPGADSVTAVQCQRYSKAREHQGGSVRDGGLQGSGQREPPGRVDQPLLGSEADRGSRPGQKEQTGGSAVQPDAS